MSYVPPETVDSPKGVISDVRVIHNQPEAQAESGSWSVVSLRWDGKERIGIRWNGSDLDAGGKGNPQSRGHPTWFVVPEELQNAVREKAEEIARNGSHRVVKGYREMARDREREAEAEDWMEGLIGDADRSKG